MTIIIRLLPATGMDPSSAIPTEVNMQPIEGKEGFYALPANTTMPYGPDELDVPRFLFPATYGRAEQEEAAARFVVLCQEAGGWVGISLPRFNLHMVEDFERRKNQQEEIETVQLQNCLERRHYNQRMHRYMWLCILTLGLYGIFAKKPSAPTLQEVPYYYDSSSFTLIVVLGPLPVLKGLVELFQRGMLRIEPSEDGEVDVLFPTPALLEPIERFRRR